MVFKSALAFMLKNGLLSTHNPGVKYLLEALKLLYKANKAGNSYKVPLSTFYVEEVSTTVEPHADVTLWITFSKVEASDGRIYEHVKDYLVELCRTELEASQATHNTYQFLLDKSTRIIQEFNQQLFLQENPVFHKAHDFQFQPSECDTSRQLESESGTTEEHSLNKEARKWATRVAREPLQEIIGRV
ncbi:F-BAR and double SH3 domains protein 2-like [Melanotaenia boesemani]|uniref:F-BAR and double SH3 domains protein 2-like n=1 Tax=Melanotaenia boesemani TaxID=1250792 RepID=UPI001C055684|nr:F-BAR and double SH3 domains protein 2-like [Melanotaenia boesemani]XP_041849885.1 F-BAR and double SH3 domains protein 2-like [Melanotaenia boesemani]XP_041849886.1 F-BAR and double SH3 domains protein 2-like [Melanotaenia boesemani]